jgi:hypothetical protein
MPLLTPLFHTFLSCRAMSIKASLVGVLLLLPPLCALWSAGEALAAEKLASTLYVKDGLAVPHQSVSIEAKLVTKGLLLEAGLGGELLELVIGGQVAATAMTGGDGKALFTYTPKALGVFPVHVRVGDSPRVASSEGAATLLVWERRNPILAVEIAALIADPIPSEPAPNMGFLLGGGRVSMPDAAEELDKLTQFYYRVVYVVTSGRVDGFHASAAAREWLQAHHFPLGYVLPLPPGENAWAEKLDELHAAGWTTIKTGIGRTKGFAEVFLQRRLEAVLVPEPPKGEAPRKAKVAKSWKEIRKILQ